MYCPVLSQHCALTTSKLLCSNVHSRQPARVHQNTRQHYWTVCATSLQPCLFSGHCRCRLPTHNRHQQESVPNVAGVLAVNEKDAWLACPVLYIAARHRDMSAADANQCVRPRSKGNEHQNEQVHFAPLYFVILYYTVPYRVYRTVPSDEMGVCTASCVSLHSTDIVLV